ncbi:hypothetical protein OG426_19945 [Streptomyces canus]|uniref:hypothetical protein n=1 Tax=Streptomyces canus TaxID=58343 RepID=UPI00224F5C9A|nr:hypothetical protein [Streptomyces canus]MCX4860210.1 hypothetical protein [Streptomyces canus]WSW34594.1 hypothetical protein OG426_19945 [Streptomyces canus]
MPKMPCPNCGSSEEFEPLRDDKEKAHVRKHKPKWTRLNAYYRCSRGSCRRFQRLGDVHDGDSFPEPEK